MSLPTPTLEGIPTELLQHIMCELTADTLPHLILTSKIIHRRFKTSEQIIINKCIKKEIEPQLWFEAFVNYEALARRNHLDCFDYVRNFMNEHWPSRDDDALGAVDLRQAAIMSAIHQVIQCFTQDFICKALAKRPASWEASPNEVVRFKRAFYIFDIYTNMFRREEWMTWSGQEVQFEMLPMNISSFLRMFSPVEMHQLSCVYDYLLGLLAPIGDYFATHDIEWANSGTKVIDWEESHIAASRVTFGVLGIAKITHAKTYEEQYKAWGNPHLRSQGLIRIGQSATMAWAQPPQNWTHTALCHLTPELEKSLFPGCFYQDPDGGPDYAWRWTNQLSTISHLLYQHAHYGLRQWAYVMWDKKRIETWGDIGPHTAHSIWYQPRPRRGNTAAEFVQLHDPSSPDSRNTISDWVVALSDIEYSVSRRREIYKAGGRGWWSKDDESKVVWEKGKASPWDDERKRNSCGDCRTAADGAQCPAHELELRIPVDP